MLQQNLATAPINGSYPPTPPASNDPATVRGGIPERTLAYLDMRVFKQLIKLGTSKERICAVMNLKPEEYDYVRALS